MQRRSTLLALLLVAAATSTLRAEIVTFNSPHFDRWMYPFNASSGSRSTAPVFGVIGGPDFDEFDGQFIVGFNTQAMGVPLLGDLPAGMKYQINSVTVTATHSTGGFTYDATFDPYNSYLPPSDPDYIADTTSGRPIELYGVGVRGGYLGLRFGDTDAGPPFFEEADIYAFAAPALKRVRNVYAYDPNYGDVSNPVEDRLFDLTPWAVGQTNLTPGSTVLSGSAGISAGSTFTLSIDRSRPEIVDSLADGLGEGGLFFSLVSLISTVEQTGGANPNFYTKENFDPAAIRPTLTLDYSIVPVPEPATWALTACAAALALPYWWRQRKARSQATR